jgi:hypothetical protein
MSQDDFFLIDKTISFCRLSSNLKMQNPNKHICKDRFKGYGLLLFVVEIETDNR